MKPLLGSFAVTLALAASFLACKQGVGDRCQVNDDCRSGVCSMSTGKCAGVGGGSQSALDALPPDAPPDAPIDAPGSGSGSGSGSN